VTSLLPCVSVEGSGQAVGTYYVYSLSGVL